MAPPARAYFMHGFLGIVFSRGMDALRGKVRALGIDSPGVYEYPRWDSICNDILTLEKGTLVFVFGHSYGANAATWVAESVYPRKIDYIGAYDPTRSPPVCSALKENVRYALCAHGSGWGSDFAGGATVPLAAGNVTTKLATVFKDESHLDIDNDLGLHGRSLSTLRAILGGA